MPSIVTIEAEARDRAGKGGARATRRAGRVPGIVYGAHEPASLIALDPRAVLRELHRPGWQSRVYELKTNGHAIRALIRDVQYHPVSDAPEHVDFQRLAPGEPIRVAVPVHFDNEGLVHRPQARWRAERDPSHRRGILRPRQHPRAVHRGHDGPRFQRQRALARPERRRGRPPGHRRPRFRGRHGGAAHQDGRRCAGPRCSSGAGGGCSGCGCPGGCRSGQGAGQRRTWRSRGSPEVSCG